MILDDPRVRAPTTRIGGDATLDDLLQRVTQRRPNDIALIDPLDRASFTDGEARSLTYAQADRMVSAIAGRLRRLGLHTDTIVGLQVANTIDGVLALLGVLRAGLIAMPLPLLWRRAEVVAALSRVGAGALIVSGRVGTVDHFDLAMNVAAEVFPVRCICGFGDEVPDGVVRLDDLYDGGKLDPIPPFNGDRPPDAGPGLHLAVVTWDQTADGPVPVGRSHAEMIAGGLAVLLEGGLQQNSVILATLTLSSFSGLAIAMMPWLLLGGTLALHQPFNADVFRAQRKATGCDTVILPGPLVGLFAQAGLLSAHGGAGLTNVVGAWRSPERVAGSPGWRDGHVRLTDVHVFGEVGLVAAARGRDGKPAAIPFGVVSGSRGVKGAIEVAEIAPTPAGTVALRGPMVPRAAFPPGAERGSLPYFKVAASGFVDTGYICRPNSATMVVTGPPPGIVSVGGYRFNMRDAQGWVAGAESSGGTLAVLPDSLCGQRLAGSAENPDAVRLALGKLGANPLLVDAFRRHSRPAA